MIRLTPGDRFVPWASQVHSGWPMKPLKTIAAINRVVLPETTDVDRRLEYVDIGSVNGFGRIRQATPMTFGEAPSRARRVPRAGDTIVSTVRTYLRAVAFIEDPSPELVCSTGFAVVSPRAGVDPKFLFYWLVSNHFVDEVCARSVGVSYPALNPSEIGQLPVAVPPLEVQRAIAEFLDRKTTAIDALITKKQGLRALLSEKRDAILTRLVTGGMNSSAEKSPSGIPWIGQLPRHWRILPIKRLARSGARTFTDGDWIETPYITDSGVRLIQTGNVGIGEFKEQGFRYVSEATFNALGCTEVMPGDVLICRLDGPVGRACLAPDLGVPMITSVDNAVLKPAAGQDPRYFVYALSTPEYLQWVQALCRVGGGFRFRISRSMLGDFKVPVPPVSEQVVIADEIDRLFRPLRTLESRLEEAETALVQYRRAVITAAVTGQLDISREERAA